jgi:uncharacterized glyoxalase superfamily protein PhnB
METAAANVQIIANIDVDDLEKAIEFYSVGLGLRLGRRLFDNSVAEMLGGSSTVHLLLKPAGSNPVPNAAVSRRYERHWTPVHLDFEVEDVMAATARAVRAGAVLEGEIQSFDWGHMATLHDPFGHGFCFLQLRP